MSVCPGAPAQPAAFDWPRRQFLGATAGAAALAWPQLAQAQAVGGGFVGPNPEHGHWLRAVQLPPHSQTAGQSGTGAQSVQVLIVGGGVAGLAAARALRLRGIHDVALLELHDSAGGNSLGSRIGAQPCPLGAHYLPVPGPDAPEVQHLLHELGLLERISSGSGQGGGAGDVVGGGYRISAFGERHLCHSPQERLFFNGAWQEGVLPLAGVSTGTLGQYQRFAQALAALQRQIKFTIPRSNGPFEPAQLALDAVTFDFWLAQHGLDDAHLRWYLNYCCRDEYGAGTAAVSAYAGVAYFAARHGFSVPGVGSGHLASPAGTPAKSSHGLFTWPQGNQWLTQRLAEPLLRAGKPRLHTGRVVTRVVETAQGVEVTALHAATRQAERWRAAHCIVALPLVVARRVVQLASDARQRALLETAARVPTAPWLVANLQLRRAPQDRGGAAPSWDNVLYGTPGLGYVNAQHQQLQALPPRHAPALLTYYRALGDQPHARQQLLSQPWVHWRDAVLAELAQAHPDLPDLVQQVDICRWGHGMAIPVPGTLALRQLNSQNGLLHLPGKHPIRRQPRHAPRVLFAHSDWVGYSVFEEAFTAGHQAGLAI